MKERRIGIRELKSALSACVREVKTGRTLVVTEHGQPVARIIPEAAPLAQRLDALCQAGTIAWSGRRLRRVKPVAKATRGRAVADLVSDNRG